MPLDYSLLDPRPTGINTPFENLAQVLQVRNQQQAAAGLAEQRAAIADERRQKAALAQQEAQANARVRALFAQVDPVTNQPIMPPIEALASEIGPEKAADIYKGFEAVRTARSGNAAKDTERIASILGGIESLPADMRPDAYKGVLQVLQSDGTLKPGQAPPVYDANFVKQKRTEALTALQQFEQQKPLEVSAGASLMSPDGKVIGTAPKPAESGGSKPASVQEYEYALTQGFKGSFEDYQNADANRKQRAASERAPYFTYQTTYDPQGRPDGAIRFDARGGPPQRVGVGEMGGQLKPPPGDLGKQSILDEVSTEQLDRLKVMFDRGAVALVGPASGRLRQIGQQVPGVPVNKTFAEFDAASSAFKNSVIKAITGAALSEAEATRIRQQIPEVTDKPAVWLAKAKQTRQNLQDLAGKLKAKTPAAAKDPLGIR